MAPRKALLITYYWPPAGGGGVQRWDKFFKYFSDFGWEPVVYAPDQSELPGKDESMVDDIPENIKTIRHPIWEPYGWYKKFMGIKKDEKTYSGFLHLKKQSAFQKYVVYWIRGNLFIPDARRF